MNVLKKEIRLSHATAMVVGTIIGASIFVQPAEISYHIPSVWGIIIVWLICGILTLFGSLLCAELSSHYSKAGGVYVYLNEAFSPLFGFLWGWAMFWIMHSGIIAAIAVVFGRYFALLLGVEESYVRYIAVACIWLLSAINVYGVRQGSNLQLVFTIIKVLAIVVIILVGFTLGSTLESNFNAGPVQLSQFEANDWVSAIIAGLFAFGGWHMVTYNAEETQNAKQTLPKALLWGTLLVTLAYLAMNALYLYILPLDQVSTSHTIAADAAGILTGGSGQSIMASLVIISTFGALSGIILSGPRVYFAMGRDQLLFNFFSAIHKKYKTPHKAIYLQAVWASVLVFTGSYRQLFTRVISIEWLFFGLMAIGLLIIRKKNTEKTSFQIRGFLFVPVVFILASFFVVFHKLITSPGELVGGIILILVGILVYYSKKYYI